MFSIGGRTGIRTQIHSLRFTTYGNVNNRYSILPKGLPGGSWPNPIRLIARPKALKPITSRDRQDPR